MSNRSSVAASADEPTPSFNSTPSPQPDPRTRWISGRALLLALLFAPLTAYWTVDQGVDVIFSLMIPPVVMTLVVAILNLGLLKVAPRIALDEGELVLFFAIQAVIGAICAEWTGVINPTIHSFAVFADQDTRFKEKVLPFVGHWLFVPLADADKFVDYRNGGQDFHHFLTRLPLWWGYIVGWTLIVTLICTAMLCINSLMRDEWTNREKLSFPIIQLPMAIAQAGAGKLPLWRSKLFVGAFGVMFLIDMINGFHFLYPIVPLINVRFIGDVAQFFPSPPFNAIGWTPVGIFPYMAVIGFFMPTDLLFSCIFFFFFRKFEQVFTYSIGYTESAGVFGGGGLIPGAPYFSEQSWGAFMALFVTAMWVARNYLKEVWQQILHGHPRGDHGVPHRFAFLGLFMSLAGLGWVGIKVGIPLWMDAFGVILFLVFSTAMTRMRAQIGAPSHEMAFMGPNQMLVDFVGTQGLSLAAVSRFVSVFFFMNRIHRTHPMPPQLEAMKLGDNARTNQRSVFGAIFVATIVGAVLGHLVSIFNGYHYTAPSAGGDVAGVIDTLTTRRHAPNPTAIMAVILAFCFVLLLDVVRFRMPGFPLHPAGYALAMNFGLDYFWFGLLIVYIIKLCVERYYGLRGHAQLRQIALGIILAEFCAETIWAVFTMTHHHQATYSISINGRLGWDQ